jgi:hypothetical protein
VAVIHHIISNSNQGDRGSVCGLEWRKNGVCGCHGPQACLLDTFLCLATEGTPNAWGILAQRWGAPDADPSKITEHPVDKVKKIPADSDRVGTVSALSEAELAALAAGALPTSGEASRLTSAGKLSGVTAVCQVRGIQ